MHFFRFGSTVLVLCLAAPALAQDSVFPSADEKKMAARIAPDQVTDEVRAFLKKKMKGHNADMKGLVMAVATLRFSSVAAGAQGIANRPRLDVSSARTAGLPEAFTELQNQLKARATELAAVAKENDADKTTTAFTGVLQTCTTCHRAFAGPRP